MPRKIAAVGLAACCLAVAVPAWADELTGPELRKLFSGETIKLSTPFGALPIKYSPSGSMVAQSAAMAAFSGVYRDTGRWRISGNRFCQKWGTWNGGKEQCFTVRRNGEKLHWTSNDGMSGTAYASN